MELTLAEQLNLTDLFLDKHVREGRGERVALIVDKQDGAVERVTYRELAARSDSFAHVFSTLGVEPEQRVLIAAEDSADFAAALFGALKMGAVVVMVNPDLQPDDASYFLSYTRAKVAVLSATTAAAFARAAHSAPLLRKLVVLGSELPPSDKAARFTDLAPSDPSPFPTFDTHKDDPAIWLFSGGTTGKPKAVVQTHGAFFNTTVLYGQNVLKMSERDVTLSVPKLFFGYATGSNLLFPLSVGGSAILFPERATAERLFELIERHRPTVLINVPTMVGKMLDYEGAARRDLSSLRIATSAGEALPEPLFQRFKEVWGVELLDGLGTAEMWHVFVTNRPGDVKPGTLGKVVSGFEMKVCDDDGRELPDGETGWLWVRGKSRALGYYQQHAKSCEAFRGEWYVSGDMIQRAPDGTYTYCGRGDDMLKVSGKWLAPKEVESCLMQHPAVEECAVVGVTDASGLVKPYAFVRARTHKAELASELQAFVRERLAPYKAPREVVFMEQFPRTHLGKVDRGQLRKDMKTAGSSR
jgi:benzoate-CoA ligase family protein